VKTKIVLIGRAMLVRGDLFSDREVDFSPCRKYRYTLWQWWDRSKGFVQWIALNPSTADDIRDDNTVRRCINFSRGWGYGGFCMTNIFAFRATDPRKMKAQEDPVGPDNDKWLLSVYKDAGLIVTGWGTHGSFLDRDEQVLELLGQIQCLGVNLDGSPKHPLYLRADTEPILYVRR